MHDGRTTRLFGIPLAPVAYADVVQLVNDALANRECITIDAINTMGLTESCRDPRMREALFGYDAIVPDGMPLVWCMNAKGADLSDRVYGPYLADKLLRELRRRTGVALIGGFSHVHDWLRRAGASRYPNADFKLLYETPQTPVDEAYVHDCMERVDRSGAELIFVCLGVPRQYYWTTLARPYLAGRVCISVGGAFDLVSGTRRIAPTWMQRAGLTWLYRMSQEPRRLGPRYLKYNSAFLWFLLTREMLPLVLSRRRRESP
jgi:N-acetylglucosaminyldiphosphoundecaprenol N-acetyl-beta-D-mannosaminyltransferase